MKKKAKPRKVVRSKKRGTKILVIWHEAGRDLEVFQGDFFFWATRGKAKIKLTGLGQYLDRDEYDVSPGLLGMTPAWVQDAAAPGSHNYKCDPPYHDNPHIIIKAGLSRSRKPRLS
jgi:hypothetical protein